MKKYLKLGPKATMFFDPTSQLHIRNNEVIALDMIPKNKKVSLALSAGHIVRAEQEEYEAYQNGGPAVSASAAVKTKEEEDEVDDVLIALSDQEFIDKVQGVGFTKKHQKQILEAPSREEQIALFRKLEKNYD